MQKPFMEMSEQLSVTSRQDACAPRSETRMKTNSETSTRNLIIAAFVLLSAALVFAPSASLQEGGGFTVNPSVVAGGGGSSTNASTNITGTIGQGILGSSSGGGFTLDGGFWQAEAPAAANSISGTISYCIDQTKKIPNAAVATTSGSPSDATTTNASGFYQLHNLGGGPYTVASSKTGAVSGISAFDAALVAQYVAGIATPTSCQQLAGDASNNGALSAFDAAFIAQTVAGISNPGIAGTWKFIPSSRSYPTLSGNLTNQNYDAVLVGDVSGNWTPAGPEGPPKGPIAAPNAPLVNVSVSLPTMVSGGAATVMVPVIVGDTTGQGIIAYDFTFTFNTSVLQLQPTPFSTTGTLSNTWNITPNTTIPGQIHIVAFNTVALSGSGTLIKINFNVVGALAATTPLTWQPPFLFNEGTPAASPLTNGNYTVTGPTAVRLEKLTATGYDGGVYLEWKTGLEADNLGFNLYRERDGQKELITPEIVAGSALLTGKTRLQTGRTYSWWDAATKDQRSAQYWLEDLDLNGQSNWHGPVSPQLVGGSPPPQSDAAVLSRIGRPETPHASTPVERRALARLNPGQSGIQPVPLGGPAVRVSVRREDWYRLSLTELVAAGFNPNPDPDYVQMYVDGEQVPINVITDDKKQLSAIEFYGTGLDAAFTDARVYLIVEGREKGFRIDQIKADAHPSSARSFTYSVERRDRTIYFSGLRNGERENFFGSVVGREAIVQSLTLQHLDRSTTEQAQVEVSLQGVTAIPHRVWVNVNGSFVGEVLFNGQELKAASLSLPPSLLREGDNEVQLAAQGGPADVSLIDYVRVSYPRSFTAENDQLRFLASAGAAVTVDGFKSAAIRVFDITNQDRVQQLVGKIEQGKNGYEITVAPAEKGERTLLAIAGQTAGAQAGVSASVASDLRSTNHAANLVIITNRDFFSGLEPLKKLRTSQGYKVEMVDVEAIYDQFSFGNKSPYAVREFLQYARANWKLAPQYVLLGGDASYDPKNYLGFGDWDIVPTKLIDTGLMETASDDWFADFNAHGVPEMAVGRLPARSKEEAASMVARIIGYEQSSGAAELTLVADANDGYDFEAATAQLRALVPGDIRVVEIDRGRMGSQAKAALIEAINRGQKIVNYTGHGNVDQWRADLLTNADAAALTNQNHLAVFVMMTCLNGYFDDPALSSLAEALMKSGPGGAVAVWASSGMTMPDEQALMNREFYRQLFANRGIALGDAINRAKAATSDEDVRRTWILLGDPTMRLK
jgi:hypothetical protein